MPWQFACLSCNETWDKTSPAAHACAKPLEYLREFWTQRLRWSLAMRDSTDAQRRALVSRPIARALPVELLGASWDPARDA